MPVSIPAGTKFEAIKPTTNVNRRSALVNAQDLTYTIEDIAAAAGGGSFPITNNYIPKANAAGSIVDSDLFQDDLGFGNGLFGNLPGGLGLTSSIANLLTILTDDLGGYSYLYLGDTSSALVPAFGISINSNALNPSVDISTNGISVLTFFPDSGQYDIGGLTTRFGIVNGDIPQASLYLTPDLVTNVGGTDYIKVIIGGVLYKIELVP